MRSMLAFAGVAALAFAACALPSEEQAAQTQHAFTSANAVLVDLELDAKLLTTTNNPPEVRAQLETQLMFLVGQLNGDRSVGRHDRLDLGVKSITEREAIYEIAYHVKLPVAWGNGTPPPSYVVTLPLRVAQADQRAFAQKYSAQCTDPEGGLVEAERMFLFFRPQRAGCAFAAEDIVTANATVLPSNENTKGKYPEYHRIWDDDELDVVAVFGRERYDGSPGDGGVGAYEAFVDRAKQYLESLQPNATRRSSSSDVAALRPNVRLMTTLPTEHKIRIDAILIGPSVADEPTFDAWYEARTPDADMIVYSGHAGLGGNVRSLSKKGTFRAKKYVINVVNGCDTFAYLDRTLADRRFILNPDDPGGTKYMDAVSNVLGGYFHTGDETSLHLTKALVGALSNAPKTYPEIFADVDATQVMVVSGEEDNEFGPQIPITAEQLPPSPSDAEKTSPAGTTKKDARTTSSNASCNTISSSTASGSALVMVAIAAIVRFRRRFARLTSDGSSAARRAPARP